MKETKSCAHRIRQLDYISAHDNAMRRMADGQKQRRCKVCKKWFWKGDFNLNKI